MTRGASQYLPDESIRGLPEGRGRAPGGRAPTRRGRSFPRSANGVGRSADGLRLAGELRLYTDVFERFPDGIVVVDRACRIVVRNAALDQLATLPPDVDPPGTCCDLFGCRRPGTPLHDACLSELVTDSPQRVSNMLLEPPRGGSGPLWITAAPLCEDASLILFQVRSAANDRLRPTAHPELRPKPHLDVQALGPLAVCSSTAPLAREWMGQRAGQLFKFLVTERHRAVPLELIADAVWPQASRSTGNTVRHCIHVLRSQLEPDAGKRGWSPYIVAENGGYRLNPDLVSVDVDDFEREIAEGLRTLANGGREIAIARFEAAIEKYRGDYLADEPFAEWTLLERERLRDLVTVPLRALAELRADDLDVAVGYLERLAEMEPLDAEVQHQLMALLIAQGRRSRAARQYRIFEQRLLLKYNQAPSFGLSDIVAQDEVRWQRGVSGNGMAMSGVWSPASRHARL